MGYPMTYDRVLNRNRLRGNYTQVRDSSGQIAEWAPKEMVPREEVFFALRAIAGDLRRLEQDTMVDAAKDGEYSYHRRLCEFTGLDSPTVRKVLHALFTDCGTMPLPKQDPHDS